MLPSLQLRPISTSHYYLSGDVVIEAGVAIAPGVLIQADPDTRVIIHSGVVIGSGTVIHAHQGDLEIGAGTIIGAEVLLIGTIQIGEQACIGAASTLFHRPALVGKAPLQIAPGELIPSGSLIGDRTRSVEPIPSSDAPAAPTVTPTVKPTVPAPEPTTAPPTHSSSNGGFSATATHGFIGVPPTASGEPVSYFHAPEVPKPDLPHQPFTEHPPTPIGTPPPPTSVSPQPSYPQPYTMPKADIPPPETPLGSNPPDATTSAIEPISNGAGTVNYVNQMLGRMFPHRQTQT